MKNKLLYIFLCLLSLTSCEEKNATIDRYVYVSFTVANNLASSINLEVPYGKNVTAYITIPSGEIYFYTHELMTDHAYDHKIPIFSADKIGLYIAKEESQHYEFNPSLYLIKQSDNKYLLSIDDELLIKLHGNTLE